MAGHIFDMLEFKTTNSNLERGKSYHTNNAVLDYQNINHRYYFARINGQRIYRVMLSAESDDFTAWCSCPYNSRGLCKHAVALALTVYGDAAVSDYRQMPPLKARLIFFKERFLLFLQRLRIKARQ